LILEKSGDKIKGDINKLSNLLSTPKNAFGVLDQRVMQLSLEIPQMIDGIYECKDTNNFENKQTF